MKDKSGTTVRLLGIAGRVLQELKTDQKWKDTKVAWVSCTDEPEWAAECLQKFKVEDGRSLNQLVDSVQIYKGIIIFIIYYQHHHHHHQQLINKGILKI